jgi:hypothetical protein
MKPEDNENARSARELCRLEELLLRFRLTSAELARANPDDLRQCPDEFFRRVLDRVMHENIELYRKLAQITGGFPDVAL